MHVFKQNKDFYTRPIYLMNLNIYISNVLWCILEIAK
jgi:hypothetical protein